MYHVLDDHDQPIHAAGGKAIEEFATLAEAGHVADALSRKTHRLYRAAPAVIDLREPVIATVVTF